MTEQFEHFIYMQKAAKESLPRFSAAQQKLTPLLTEGVCFSAKKGDFRLRFLDPNEQTMLDRIVEVVSTKPQLAGLNYDSLITLASNRLAIIAEGRVGNSWELASYLGAEVVSPEERAQRHGQVDQGLALVEIRSSFTLTGTETESGANYQGNGLNPIMKIIQTCNLNTQTEGLLPIGFTESIPAFVDLPPILSEAIGLNQKLGMESIKINDLSTALRKMLTEPCPEKRCVPRGDAIEGQCACECKLFYFNPITGLPGTRIPQIDTILKEEGVLRTNA